MRRREFLAMSAAALATTSVASARGADPSSTADPTGTRIRDRRRGSSLALSLAAYSFRKQLDLAKPSMTLADFIDYCAECELDAVELTSYYFARTDAPYLCDLRRRATVNGLAISGMPIRSDFCLAPGAARDEQLAQVRSWIVRAQVLGAQTIRVFGGDVPKGDDPEAARERAVAGLREVATFAGEHGVVLALENHGGITANADDLLALVTAVDSPWLGVNLDTGNFRTRAYASLEQAAPWAVAVQVKVEVRDGEAPAKCDYRRVAEILRGAGYRGYVALEYESAEDPRVAVPRELQALRAAFEA